MNDFIQTLKNKFAETVPGEDELIQAFETYLITSVEDIKNSEASFVKKDEESIQNTLTYLVADLLEADIEEKKAMLLPDENLEKIRENSYEAFQLAQKKMRGEKLSIQYDIEQKKSELKTWIAEVKEYHQMEAKSLVSEGLLDWNYIANDDAKLMSMRIGRKMKKKS